VLLAADAWIARERVTTCLDACAWDGSTSCWRAPRSPRRDAPTVTPCALEMGAQVPRPRRYFPPEYKAEVVELICTTGKTVGQVARELGLTETAVREWVKRADLDAGRRTTASPAPGVMSCAGCVVRSESWVRSARSCARLRCSSPGRPVAGELLSADRRGEATPPGLPTMSRAGCGTRRLQRLGRPPPPSARVDAPRPDRHPSAGPGGADLHVARAGPAVGGRHHPAAHRPELAVPGGGPGRLLAAGRRLVDGRPAHRARPGRPRHGHRPAQSHRGPGAAP
jgi:transposase-like protein